MRCEYYFNFVVIVFQYENSRYTIVGQIYNAVDDQCCTTRERASERETQKNKFELKCSFR